MTSPYDPDQPPPNYGGIPSYPSAPQPSDYQPQRITPPNEIMAAFWCYVAAALILVVGGLFALGERQQLIEDLRLSQASQGLTDAQLQAAATASIIITLVIVIVIAGLFVLFAFKMRQGRNWARIVLTVLAAFALLSLLFAGSGGSVLRLVGDLASVAGAVLTYLPKSSMYFAASRQARFNQMR